jgi:hypothetical protein
MRAEKATLLAMPHWQARAEADACERGRPRGITKFVCPSTGVCSLCGFGLGKRFSKEDRKYHQQSYQHVANYNSYSTEFEAARPLFLEELAAKHLYERQQLGRRLADEDTVACEALVTRRLCQLGLSGWLETSGGDILAVKAAVLDTLLSDTFENRVEASHVVERHIKGSRRLLARQVAVSVLSESPDGAHVAGRLCAACV